MTTQYFCIIYRQSLNDYCHRIWDKDWNLVYNYGWLFFNFLPSEMNCTFKILLCKLQDVKLFFPVLLFFSLTSSREEKVVE